MGRGRGDSIGSKLMQSVGLRKQKPPTSAEIRKEEIFKRDFISFWQEKGFVENKKEKEKKMRSVWHRPRF